MRIRLKKIKHEVRRDWHFWGVDGAVGVPQQLIEESAPHHLYWEVACLEEGMGEFIYLTRYILENEGDPRGIDPPPKKCSECSREIRPEEVNWHIPNIEAGTA